MVEQGHWGGYLGVQPEPNVRGRVSQDLHEELARCIGLGFVKRHPVGFPVGVVVRG